MYRALSPRQPRFPPPGYSETWETRADDAEEEEVELEGESIDTETGAPRALLADPVEAAPEVPAGSPEVVSAVDLAAATEPATEERSASVEDTRVRARKLRSKPARPTSSRPSPSVSEQEEKPPVEERVKPPPSATSAKAKTKKESSETGDIEREQGSAVDTLKRALGCESSSRAREGEGSSGSGLRRESEALPVPPPVPSKEKIEQAEIARQQELENLPNLQSREAYITRLPTVKLMLAQERRQDNTWGKISLEGLSCPAYKKT